MSRPHAGNPMAHPLQNAAADLKDVTDFHSDSFKKMSRA